MNKKLVLTLTLASVLLAACFPSGVSESDLDRERTEVSVETRILDARQVLAIASASPDYSTSDIALITNQQAATAVLLEGQFATTNPNDIGVATFESGLYRLGRFGFDNLTHYRLGSLAQPALQWQYAVDGDDASANPVSLVFSNASQAFLLRYDAPTAWVVNPSVQGSGSGDFKQDELDLSAYAHAESGGTPRMNDALIADNRLYILMERLDSNFQAMQKSYVAVFDLDTLTEIDTGGSLKGIELPVRNAANLSYHQGTVYVAGRGNTAWGATEGEKVRGLVGIDTSTHQAELIFDGSQSAFDHFGAFQKVLIAGDQHGYLVGRAGWGNDTLYHFNPADPSQSLTPVEGLQGVSIADLHFNALSDADATHLKLLYVAVQAGFDPEDQGRMVVVNVQDQSLVAELGMAFNPTDIEVIER